MKLRFMLPSTAAMGWKPLEAHATRAKKRREPEPLRLSPRKEINAPSPVGISCCNAIAA
jgi:hypothetical protein